MGKNNIWSKVGVWSFVAGLVIAIFVAVFSGGKLTPLTMGILAVLGLLVGLLNVTDDELQLFLLASLVFLVAAGAMNSVVGLLPATLAGWLGGFFSAIVVFTAPVAFLLGFAIPIAPHTNSTANALRNVVFKH